MTNFCKCGHVKSSHGYTGYSDGSNDIGEGICRTCSNNLDLKNPCKKFKPKNQSQESHITKDNSGLQTMIPNVKKTPDIQSQDVQNKDGFRNTGGSIPPLDTQTPNTKHLECDGVEANSTSLSGDKTSDFNLSEKIWEKISYLTGLREEIIYTKDVREFIRSLWEIPLTGKQLAEEFHKTYENFALNNGWKTQEECRVIFDKLPKKNKETMIDTSKHILCWIEAILMDKINKKAGDKLI